MTSPFILVDGSSYFFRAFHALPPLTNSKGQPTGAVYGVLNMIKRLIKDYVPTHMVVVFDAKGKTFRDLWYPDYKAHRPPTPPDLSSQFQPLLDMLKAMGIPTLIVEGVEADDVIGTLSTAATLAHVPVLISTGDKDMAQLVNPYVTLVNTMTQQVLNEASVFDKFGVHPEQIIDYLTLVGDTSDNVPGVPKCGPKTAVKWLEQYKTLDHLIEHANDISGKIGESLRASLSFLDLSKRLVTIKKDVSLPCALDTLILGQADHQAMLALAKELEFKTWVNALSVEEKQPETTHKASFEVITHEAQLAQWIEKIRLASHLCVDTETTDLDTLRAELVGLALCVDAKDAAYIPLTHTDGSPQLSRERVLDALKPWLELKTLPKLGQNLKYDYSIFQNYNITLGGMTYDTMLESYLLNSTSNRHDMDTLALTYLGYKTIRFEDIAGKGAKALRFDQIPVDKAAPYAAEDASITLRLHETLYPKLDVALRAVLHDIEMPLVPILATMERLGVLIDEHQLKDQGLRLRQRLQVLEQDAYQLAQKTFNLNSPKQLQQILYDDLKLPVLEKTPTGQPSTAESTLQALAADYPLPALLIEYRGLSKLVSTYIDALPKRINPITGRVHTSYNQAITATGRLSSTDPNLQNIPIKTEEGRLIRRAFIAPIGHCLLTADYSQIELRIMAHLSNDPALQRAFSQGLDIHQATASEIFSVPLEEVTHEQRRRAKAVNFGLIYGMSSFGLAKQLGVDRSDAQHYIDCYFNRYPGVFDYMERTRQQAHARGYVETILGRRLYLPEINVRNKMRQKAAERMAINAPMQGTAADIIKKAMIAVDHWQKSTPSCPARMIMQVHDELVFEVEEQVLEEVRSAIKTCMEEAVILSVPLLVSIGVGKNWDEAH